MKTYKVRMKDAYNRVSEKEYIAANKLRAIKFGRTIATQKKAKAISFFECQADGTFKVF